MDEDVPGKLEHYTNIFMLHHPMRPKGGFPLLAEDVTSKTAWIAALQETIRSSKNSVVQYAYTPAPSAKVAAAAAATATVSPPTAQHREQHSYEEEETISKKVATVI